MMRILFLGLLLVLNASTLLHAQEEMISYPSPLGGYSPFECGVSYCEPYRDRFDGLYLGVNLGGISHTSHRNDLNGLFNIANYTTIQSHIATGVLVGYDWQCCQKLLGFVVDWNWTHPRRILHFNTDEPSFEQHLTNTMYWFATIRGRAGLALDDILVYVTAGGAVTKLKTQYFSRPATLTQFLNIQKSRWGWTGGVGMEWALCGPITLNFEVLYLSFSSRKFSATLSGVFDFDHSDSAFVGRFGLNYRFCH